MVTETPAIGDGAQPLSSAVYSRNCATKTGPPREGSGVRGLEINMAIACATTFSNVLACARFGVNFSVATGFLRRWRGYQVHHQPRLLR